MACVITFRKFHFFCSEPHVSIINSYVCRNQNCFSTICMSMGAISLYRHALSIGIKNVQPYFQRLILSGCKSFSEAYVDDIVVYNRTWGDHSQHPEHVLLSDEAGLMANQKKCVWGQTSCTYLGHRVGGERVELDASKVSVIEDFVRP